MDLDNLRIRKPARRISEIPPSVLDALAAGQLQTKNLVDWLATNRERLLEVIFTQFGLVDLHHSAEIWTDKLLGESALKQSFAIGQWWLEHCKVGDDVWRQLSTHESDIVREWAAIVVGRSSDLSFARKLAWIKPFADDAHSGLREIAWLALRPARSCRCSSVFGPMDRKPPRTATTICIGDNASMWCMDVAYRRTQGSA